MGFRPHFYRLIRSRLGRALGFPAVVLASALILIVLRASSPRPGSTAAATKAMASVPPTVAGATPVSDAAVGAAVAKAKAYLVSLASSNQWEVVPAPEDGAPGVRGRRWGLLTALAADALAAWSRGTGIVYSKECSAAGDWLRRAKVDDPTTLALRLRLYDAPLPYPERQKWKADRAADLDRLLKSPAARGPPACDLETCLTVARCLEGSEREDALPDAYWNTLDAALRKAQQPDGSWRQGDSEPAAVRVALTAHAAATLLFIRGRQFDRRRAGCEGEPPDPALEGAMAWLDAHAAEGRGDPEASFAAQRLVSASGRGSLGRVDWYNTAASDLLGRQNPDGSWPAAATLTGADSGARRIPETVYAILFLTAGETPVVMGKLMYGNPSPAPPTAAPATPSASAPTPLRPLSDWRPADLARFAEWAGTQLCNPPLGWRQVRPNDRDLSDFDAALLYVSGSGPLSLAPAEEDALRAYVRRGGMVLGNADCAGKPFADAFTALGSRLFPGYAFRELPPDHCIFNGEMFRGARWRPKPKVLGLSNGVRELMVLVPDADLGGIWQTRRSLVHREAYELGLDLLLYADHEILGRPRAAAPFPRRDPEVALVRPLKVARLLYPGNADPEPGGWERLALLMHNQFRTDLEVCAVKLGTGELAAGHFLAAHLTGTDALALTAADRAELVSYVNSGGTLVVDAAGGSRAFADAAARELSAAFPPAAGAPSDGSGLPGAVLNPGDAVYGGVRGAAISAFAYRRYCRGRLPGRLNAPRVRGLTVNGRTAVFFSPEDLSAGLTGTEADGILGYDPATATAILRNLLLYAAAKQ